MGSDDAIATGLLALRMLTDPDGWDAMQAEHGERVYEVLTFQLQTLLDALPDETVRQARYRERLATLVGLLESAPRPWERVPDAVVAAARACLGPVPLSGTGGASKEPRRPPPMIGHFAPARAMAAGGGATDRYSNDDLSPIQRAIEELAEKVSGVALIIDKHGMLVAAAGDASTFDTTVIANALARDFLGSLATALFLGQQEFATHYVEGANANVHIQIVARRLILIVLFDGRTSLGLVRLRVKKVIEAMVGEGPGALRAFEVITQGDIDAMLGDSDEPDDEDD